MVLPIRGALAHTHSADEGTEAAFFPPTSDESGRASSPHDVRREASATVSVLDYARSQVRLQGFYRPAWLVGMCAGLAERGVSITRAHGTTTDGWWQAELEILPPHGLDPHSIPYAQLAELMPDAVPGSLQLERYSLTESPEHGGTLRLELEAEDNLGFLGRVLSLLAMLSLFPLAVQIETRSGRAHDCFWLSGVGKAVPTPQSRLVLERMLMSSTKAVQTGLRARPPRS